MTAFYMKHNIGLKCVNAIGPYKILDHATKEDELIDKSRQFKCSLQKFKAELQ